jgi:hypothetical protein
MSDIEIKAAEPDVAQPLRPGWLSRLLVGGGLAASLAAHIAVGSVVLFASPKLFATVPEETMAIDIVSPKEFEEAKGQATAAAGPEGQTLDAKTDTQPDGKTDTTAAIKPSADPTPPPVQQPRVPASVSKPVAPPLASAQRLRQPPPQLQPPQSRASPPQLVPPAAALLPPTLSANVPAEAAPPPAATSRPNNASPEQTTVPPDPQTIVDLLHLPVEMADTSPGGTPSESASNLSPEEIAAFKGHLKQCWVPPSGIPQVPNKLEAVVRVSLGPDGRLMAEPALLAVHGAGLVFGPTLVQSFMNGLARCQPYNMLPAEKYNEWKILDLNFSQDGVSAVSPPPATAKGDQKG